MSLTTKLLAASGGLEKLYSSDVFSAYTYTGNGSTQAINNGIALLGKGGMVWTKCRGSAYTHNLNDTAQGAGYRLRSESTVQTAYWPDTTTAFTSSGYTLGANTDGSVNQSGATYVSHTFRRAPKFFDVVTYTGTGSTNNVAHSLGILPGMVVCKATSTTSNWGCVHRSIDTYGLSMNSAAAANNKFSASGNTSTTFNPNEISDHTGSSMNVNGVTYVAYLFAHDASADGIIQCGSYVGNGSTGGPSVALGWEPQYLLVKSYQTAGNWQIIDNMRGMPVGSADMTLQANLSDAETAVDYVSSTATGFSVTSGSADVNTNGITYIYLAIRRPNKPPTLGTQVYNSISSNSATGTQLNTGFPVDMQIAAYRDGATNRQVVDRLRGVSTNTAAAATSLRTNTADAEVSTGGASLSWSSTGFQVPATWGSINAVFWNFKRAPGVFSILCDTGTAVNKLESHNLGSIPELMIRKGRSGATQWEVYFSSLGNTKKLVLNSTAAEATDITAWNSTSPTATQMSIGTSANVNTNAATYVTYLMSSLTGISKIGTYTGNGTSQTVDMGFTSGARFFLVKASSTTGSWWVFDSVRGVVASTDFGLQLNSTAAEVTSADAVDPATVGIVVVQEGTCSLNANGIIYQYWGIA